MSPPPEKVGGHVPRVPHQIAPMYTSTFFQVIHSSSLLSDSCDALQINTPQIPKLFSHASAAIGNPEQQVRKASHCGSKKQKRSCAAITLILLVRATYIWVLFFAHIPFMVNHTFNATPTEKLQE